MGSMWQRGRARLALLIFPLVLAAAVLASWFAWEQSRRRAEVSARAIRLEIQNRDLTTHAQQLARENQALRDQLAALGAAAPQSLASRPGGAAPGSNLEQARLLVKLESELASAGTTIADLQTRIAKLEETLAETQEENKRLAASEQELRERLASDARVLEAVRAELKSRNERLTQLETTNLLLHKENREATQKAAQTRQLLRELEELNRRRENLVANIMRRYREVTDQLRALAVRPEGAAEIRAVDAPELARVQNAVAMTEEDLRQLGNLNSQAARLQRKITEP